MSSVGFAEGQAMEADLERARLNELEAERAADPDYDAKVKSRGLWSEIEYHTKRISELVAQFSEIPGSAREWGLDFDIQKMAAAINRTADFVNTHSRGRAHGNETDRNGDKYHITGTPQISKGISGDKAIH